MNIRSAKASDIEAIIQLCAEHAVYEKATFDAEGKTSSLAHALFSKETIRCLVVEEGNEIVGYATFMKQFSTWDACYYIYLDCLFLKENAKGKGIGQKVMDTIKAYAREENCDIVQWQTPDFNKDAIKFYNRMGAMSKSKKRFFWTV